MYTYIFHHYNQFSYVYFSFILANYFLIANTIRAFDRYLGKKFSVRWRNGRKLLYDVAEKRE